MNSADVWPEHRKPVYLLKYSCEQVHQYKVSVQVSEARSCRFRDWCAGANVAVEESCGILTVYLDNCQKQRFDRWVKGL